MLVRDWTHFRLRLPPDLHKKLKEHAASERRSINAELTLILEKYFGEIEKDRK
ncbi:Arc family DNA-binding protein [Acetobacter senegalensis]|uniref:Arc family DNA-binding protein n=1 Tax=Acetobacter senegalensis TaxID=446692 RepID=UPI0038D02E72|nr:Arc family DNA-binding protein [Acetobacter senegalensis]MCG4268129.1 Arc family DNA-binding protein [Acetobacter senegalensis]